MLASCKWVLSGAITAMALSLPPATADEIDIVQYGVGMGAMPYAIVFEHGGVDIMAMTEPLISQNGDKYRVVFRAQDLFPPMTGTWASPRPRFWPSTPTPSAEYSPPAARPLIS